MQDNSIQSTRGPLLVNVKPNNFNYNFLESGGISTVQQFFLKNLVLNEGIHIIDDSMYVKCKKLIARPPMLNHVLDGYSEDILLLNNQKSIITLHDLQDLDYPNFFSKKELQKRRLIYNQIENNPNYFVVAISNFTRDRILNYLKIQPERVQVIHHGLDHVFNYVKKSNCNSRRPFVFVPGKAWKHKGQSELIPEVIKFAKFWRDNDIRFIFSCSFKELGHSTKVLLSKSFAQDIIEFHPRFDLAHQISILSSSRAVILPSIYEGFGLSFGEASVLGIPIFSFDLPSYEEQPAPHIHFRATNFDFEHLVTLLKNHILNLNYDDPGQTQLDLVDFEWAKVAQKYISLYRNFVSK